MNSFDNSTKSLNYSRKSQNRKSPYLRPNKYKIDKPKYISPKRSSKGKYEDINLGMSMTTITNPTNSLINKNRPRRPNIREDTYEEKLTINRNIEPDINNQSCKTNIIVQKIKEDNINNYNRETKNYIENRGFIVEKLDKEYNKISPQKNIEIDKIKVEKLNNTQIQDTNKINNNNLNNIGGANQIYDGKKIHKNTIKNYKQSNLDKTYIKKKSEKEAEKQSIKQSLKKEQRRQIVNNTHNYRQNYTQNYTKKNEFTKIIIKTEINNYKNNTNYLDMTLFSSVKDNLAIYKNLPAFEDKYIASMITSGIKINKKNK